MTIPEIYSRYHIPPGITVQVDTREQYPVLFPATIQIPHPERMGKDLVIKVKTQRIKLPFGDYRLAEYPDCCVMERKASQLELFKNLLESLDSIRQARAFRRLSTCEYPYILLEAPPSEVLQPTKQVKNPDRLVAGLAMAVAKYRLNVLWIPWKRSTPAVRRKLGAIMVHIMLACAIHKTLDISPVLLYNTDNEDMTYD